MGKQHSTAMCPLTKEFIFKPTAKRIRALGDWLHEVSLYKFSCIMEKEYKINIAKRMLLAFQEEMIIENYHSGSSLQMSNVTNEAKPRLKFLISTLEMCKSSSSASKAIVILYDNLQHKIKVNITSYLHEKLIKEIHSATKLIYSGQKCETLTLPYVTALVPALNLTFPLSVKVPPTTLQTRRKQECASKRREDLLHKSNKEYEEEQEEEEDKKELLPPTTTPPAKRTKITTVSPPKNRTKSTTSQIKSIISKEKP
ncbi:hypothetical protein SELMODRAFT_432440 [Selaginella moellendorffii]|uniref:Uncharacterized protein n=1 Tax=Selaginella moellendorffii TaxID=88036 RepID=D8TG04_SELML|nr:hypothetical protein SELMODRAFT_432440 [Selaginella moellendorffii]